MQDEHLRLLGSRELADVQRLPRPWVRGEALRRPGRGLLAASRRELPNRSVLPAARVQTTIPSQQPAAGQSSRTGGLVCRADNATATDACRSYEI